MKATTKLELKLKLRMIGMTALVLFVILICAILFNKYIEAVFFSISHYFMRPKFKKQYHLKSTYLCMALTCTIAYFGIIFTMPIGVSIISSMPIAFIVCFFGYIAQDRIDLFIELKKYKQKTIWNMNEEELSNYLTLKGIINDRAKFVKLILKGWTIGQIAEKLGYAECTLWDWSKICKDKLKIKSWKIDKN